MHTHSAMAITTQRQAEDRALAREHALVAGAPSRRHRPSVRQLFRLRRAPLPGAVPAPQGAVRSWRLSR
jgi:hypothetical protein